MALLIPQTLNLEGGMIRADIAQTIPPIPHSYATGDIFT